MSVAKNHPVGCVAALALSPIIVSILVAAAAAWLLVSVAIMGAVILLRARGEVSHLVVYSDSARWKHYFEAEVIPGFGRRARIINLSTDGGGKKWRHLDWLIYRHCAGYRDRFPVVLRFSPLGTWSAVRFYAAFMKAQKGETDDLAAAKARLRAWSHEG